MKICIDGLSINYLKGTGNYTYTHGLFNKLFEIYPQPIYEFLWYRNELIPEWQKFSNISCSNIEISRANTDNALIEEHLMNSKTDLFISPNNGLSIPPNKVCKYIMTVQDLAPLSIHNLVDEKYYHRFTSVFPQAIKNADSVIAVSDFIKSEIIRYFNIPDHKIHVIYPGCVEIFRPIAPVRSKEVLKERYHIEGDFILYAGSLHKRKNIDIIIRAFHQLVKDDNFVKLVIVSDFGAKRKEYYLMLKDLIHTLNIDDKVIFTGLVEYTDLPYFYNCAVCAVNLSCYEGFPLSSMEASACGTPVICVRNPSFEGVFLQTAIYLDTPEVSLLKATIQGTLTLSRIKRTGNSLIFHENQVYNWDKGAKELVRIIENSVYGS